MRTARLLFRHVGRHDGAVLSEDIGHVPPAALLFEITICDLKNLNSSNDSWNMKSLGILRYCDSATQVEFMKGSLPLPVLHRKAKADLFAGRRWGRHELSNCVKDNFELMIVLAFEFVQPA